LLETRKAGTYTPPKDSYAFIIAISRRASPRLKDAQLTVSECADLYVELVLVVRKMFHQCKLVHADLSEYNILYHEGHLWIIDVSQSVEHDHPSAFDFLRNDIKNVEEFFGRLGVTCLGLRRCFDFITKVTFASDSGAGNEDEAVLRRWLEEEEIQPISSVDSDASRDNNSHRASLLAHEDSVFLQSFIPRTLNEVYDPERDVEKLTRGEGHGLIYAKTIGLINPAADVVEEGKDSVKDTSKASVHFEGEPVSDDSGSSNDSDGNEHDEDGDESEDDLGEGGEGFTDRKPRGHRHEDRDAKKVRLCKSIVLQALTIFEGT
jgi:RIO kinase 1